MDCNRVGEMIFLFFDNELPGDDAPPFRDHVDRCPACAARIAYTRKLMILFRHRCARCSAPTALRRRILISLPHRRGLA